MKRMIEKVKSLYHLLIAIFANIWFRFPARKLTVIGVTGTDGKTTTTTLIYEILRAAGIRASMISSVHAVIGGVSYDTGFHVTTPSAFWIQKYLRDAVAHGDTHMVLEVTSHGLSQHRVFGIPFAVGVLTNVTHEHLDWHRTFARYVQAKMSLLARAHMVVVNRDYAEVYNMIIPRLRRKTVITYAIRREAKFTPGNFPFTTKLPGEFNVYNCLAAIAATISLGIKPTIIRSAIASFSGVSGRMETVVSSPFRVIVDFAHTPNAITQALRTLKKQTKKRLIHVFGSAGLRDVSKRPLMGRASSTYADSIILTEEDYRTENVETIMDEIEAGIKGNAKVYRFADRGDAIAYAISEAKPGDTVMITGKGHEQSLCRGKKEFPWSDQKEVFKLLKHGIKITQ